MYFSGWCYCFRGKKKRFLGKHDCYKCETERVDEIGGVHKGPCGGVFVFFVFLCVGHLPEYDEAEDG